MHDALSSAMKLVLFLAFLALAPALGDHLRAQPEDLTPGLAFAAHAPAHDRSHDRETVAYANIPAAERDRLCRR
jgi:hypothetical protein